MLLDAEKIKIIELHNKGLSMRAVAKQTGHDFRSVRKTIKTHISGIQTMEEIKKSLVGIALDKQKPIPIKYQVQLGYIALAERLMNKIDQYLSNQQNVNNNIKGEDKYEEKYIK